MTKNNPNKTHLRCAGLEFDLELGIVKNSRGDVQRLSPVNLKLLAYLMEHAGEVISRADLFDAVWPNQILSDDVLTRAVSDIRMQLAKLDGSAKFIDTLPKRGYRWALEITPHAEQALNISVEPVAGSILPSSNTSPRWFSNRFINGGLYVLASLLVAVSIMWWVGRSAGDQIKLAVLPTSFDRPQTEILANDISQNIVLVARKIPHVKLLSNAAIASRPQNPFPYFFKEFGAKWVLESRVSDLDGMDSVELILVDARSGLELRNIKIEMASRSDLIPKIAQKLEFDLLVELQPY